MDGTYLLKLLSPDVRCTFALPHAGRSQTVARFYLPPHYPCPITPHPSTPAHCPHTPPPHPPPLLYHTTTPTHTLPRLPTNTPMPTCSAITCSCAFDPFCSQGFFALPAWITASVVETHSCVVHVVFIQRCLLPWWDYCRTWLSWALPYRPDPDTCVNHRHTVVYVLDVMRWPMT